MYLFPPNLCVCALSLCRDGYGQAMMCVGTYLHIYKHSAMRKIWHLKGHKVVVSFTVFKPNAVNFVNEVCRIQLLNALTLVFLYEHQFYLNS